MGTGKEKMDKERRQQERFKDEQITHKMGREERKKGVVILDGDSLIWHLCMRPFTFTHLYLKSGNIYVPF